MANLKSEQLKSDLNLEIAIDQPLKPKEMEDVLIRCLGKNNCKIIKYQNKRLVCFKEKTVFLCASVTYLGGNGQHPIFKKRIQLPNWWKEYVINNKNYDVRFLGIYHYKGNIVFVDFIKDTFVKRKMNNSSAFVYTNDIYQAMKEGVFSREDVKGNTRYAIKYTRFSNYIEGKSEFSTDDTLFKLFGQFNSTFKFNQNINIIDALSVLYETNDLSVIRETEWAGWYLENRFKTFTKEVNCENNIKYIGKSNKKKGDLDFDLWFPTSKFYGDLKASDINKKEAPGNDKESFFESINKFDRFWYVIYEHQTEKEDATKLQASTARRRFLESKGLWKEPAKHNYNFHRCIKYNVNFKSMMIIELNRINCHQILSDFNQGKQPDDKKRNVKVNINKRNIENFIVYNYTK